MKILNINFSYPLGSTGKITHDLHELLLADGNQSIVCYGRGKKLHDKDVIKVSTELEAKLSVILSMITGFQFMWSFFATKKLINTIKRENPDVVHLQCLNGNFINIYKLISFLKTNKINTVLTLHAEFMYTGGCSHSVNCDKWITGCYSCPSIWYSSRSLFFDQTSKAWDMMYNVFRDFGTLIIVPVSQWVESRVLQSPFFIGRRVCTIWNGIDNKKYFYKRDTSLLKSKMNLNNQKILLHVTANFDLPSKGGGYIIELAKRFINYNVKIVVIGLGRRTDFPDNLLHIPFVSDMNELSLYYNMADLTILTSERETYSMVCAESLSCGTPVVGFKAGGPELISLKEYSEFVDYGDINQLEIIVLKWINVKHKISNSISAEAEKVYSREEMYRKYKSLYKSFIVNG